MKSIREIYNIGYGPSSSHTMGPSRAAGFFVGRHPEVEKIRVTLYGSLALTGKGHGTDTAIMKVVPRPEDTEIIWKPDITLPKHPNGMVFEAISQGQVIDSWTVYSIGGGALWDEIGTFDGGDVYPTTSMSEVIRWCLDEGCTFVDYVTKYEGEEIFIYLEEVWKQMQETLEKGLQAEGVLPGALKLARKASSYNIKAMQSSGSSRPMGMLFAAALAVSEENAGGGRVVTAPTCGASGVVPAVMYFLKHDQKMPDYRIIRGLATAALIGNIVKSNGSISGAEVGCQGELGTACAMAAGAATQIWGGTPRQIEYAAEMGFEHNLGLTCDPVLGYVQIPCIERNAFVAQKAREAALYALFSDGRHMVSFDEVVKTMMETGRDMQAKYRETSLGGLASVCIKRLKCDLNDTL
ncbi:MULTISPECIES: L-serine ammonia-lyase [Culturomica]|jgi:L-serine dehydratase|uniref:L-serine ammonia-lyase n=1 Tax=Culturomica TaxID=1926651 RepID=UPI000335AF04|nr:MULTISPECIES: L-serine ammonia-lyase [Odoribacteraceae]RHV98569.1 L-serine ammonia-lyase [Odoribacter sp. OF09-27XD]CCZ06353.1 l-serine ammonia-lyase [Odoribacter sp. CAG:788]HBO25944.1 L-serine ammonia-lyase [Culturomica sp.]